MSTSTDLDFGLGGSPKPTFWQDVILGPTGSTSVKAKRLADYWDRIRRDRSMPARRDIDPIEIWPLVPNIHLSEWHRNPDRVRYRLAGTELVAVIGREISGRWLGDLHADATDIEETLGIYRQAIALRAPLFGRSAGTNQRMGVEAFEWVLCPLSDDNDEVTHFIGLEDYVAQRRYLGGVS